LGTAATNPLLPVCEIEEQLSVLSGRIPGFLSERIISVLTDFKNSCQAQAGSGVQLR
jgi:hypothetical protein